MSRARRARVGLAAAALGLAAAAHSQTGPFTEAQAAAGRSSYLANCAGCHLTDLRGANEARPLVGTDFMRTWSGRTAQELVVYYRRPGGQSQFSALLELERADGRFGALLDHVREHLGSRLSVEVLARRAGMSPRHFAREFHRELGVTPARAVERLRTETAHAALASGAASIEDVARKVGFGGAERMRRSFLRVYGKPPSAVKREERVRAK